MDPGGAVIILGMIIGLPVIFYISLLTTKAYIHFKKLKIPARSRVYALGNKLNIFLAFLPIILYLFNIGRIFWIGRNVLAGTYVTGMILSQLNALRIPILTAVFVLIPTVIFTSIVLYIIRKNKKPQWISWIPIFVSSIYLLTLLPAIFLNSDATIRIILTIWGFPLWSLLTGLNFI